MIPKGFIEIPLFVWSHEEKEAHDEALLKWRKEKTGPRPTMPHQREELSCLDARAIIEIRDSVEDDVDGRPRRTAITVRIAEHEWSSRRMCVATSLPYAQVRDMVAAAIDEVSG